MFSEIATEAGTINPARIAEASKTGLRLYEEFTRTAGHTLGTDQRYAIEALDHLGLRPADPQSAAYRFLEGKDGRISGTHFSANRLLPSLDPSLRINGVAINDANLTGVTPTPIKPYTINDPETLRLRLRQMISPDSRISIEGHNTEPADAEFVSALLSPDLSWRTLSRQLSRVHGVLSKYPFSLRIMSGGMEHKILPDNIRTGYYDSAHISGFRVNDLAFAEK